MIDWGLKREESYTFDSKMLNTNQKSKKWLDTIERFERINDIDPLTGSAQRVSPLHDQTTTNPLLLLKVINNLYFYHHCINSELEDKDFENLRISLQDSEFFNSRDEAFKSEILNSLIPRFKQV